jgi:hypothetical protein
MLVDISVVLKVSDFANFYFLWLVLACSLILATIFFIGNYTLTHPGGLEPTTSPSIFLL